MKTEDKMLEIYNFCKKLISTENLSRKQWLEYRQKGIGGSDISSACGVNQWKSPLALWHEKVTKIEEEEEENLPAEVGIALEPLMKIKTEKWIKKNEGLDISVLNVPYILQHPDNKIALANLDGAFVHPGKGTCITEYKTTSERNYKEWMDDNLPDYHYLQTQHYLYVTNCRYCYLAFMFFC